MKLLQLPLLFPIIFLIGGILAGFYINYKYWHLLLPAIVGSSSLLCLTLYSKCIPIRTLKTTKWKALSVATIFMTVGMLSYELSKSDKPEIINYGNAITTTIHVEEVYSTTAGEKLIGRIIATYDSIGNIICTPYGIRSIIYTPPMSFRAGDILMIPAVNFQPLKPNPQIRHNEYIESLKNDGIVIKQFCNTEDINFISHTPDIKDRLSHIRDKLTIYIENSRISHKTSSFLITILLGDNSFISSDTRTSFTQAGIAHILALSGLHIAIRAVIVMTVLLPLNLICNYKARIIITLILIWIYTLITGANYSTVRAAIMITAAFIARIIERKNSALNALLLSAMIILVLQPTALWNIGMQLSFVAVASILMFTEQLNPFDRSTHPYWHRTIASLLVCLIATTATVPICAFHFKSIPIQFLVTNSIVLPLLPSYIIIALTHFSLVSIGAGTLTSYLLDKGYDSLFRISNLIATDGAGTIKLSISELGALGSLILILVIAIILNSNLNRKTTAILGSCSLLFTIIICCYTHIPPPADGIIIQSRAHEITIAHYINDNEHLISCPRGQCTMLDFPNYNIIIADGNPHITDTSFTHCDILVIGRNCQWSFNSLSEIYNPDLVVIHSSLLPHLRENISQECEARQIPVHSLAEQGPLAIEFKKTFTPGYTL